MSNNGKKIVMGAVIAIILAIGLGVGAMYLAPPNTTTGGSNTSSNHNTSSQSSQGTTSGILGSSGTMNIYLTDAPPVSPQFKYLLINVSSVVLQYSGNVSTSAPQDQWVYNISASAGTNVNITSLSNHTVLLGATSVPAGNVTGVIFTITGARAFYTGGNSTQLKVVADGKLMLHINFTVATDGSNNLTVDITPNSVHVSNGNTPVLRPVLLVTETHSGGSTTSTVTASTSMTETTSTTSSTTS